VTDPLHDLVRERMAGLPVLAHDPADGIPLQVPSYGPEEVVAALECLIGARVTMGECVRAFEAAFAAWVGTRHAVMCNSGSSANLLAWSALVQTGRLDRGDEVLVPAVAWSTTLFPVAQAGLVPRLVDVDPGTLCLDPALARAACGPRTRAACPVHLLGCAAEVAPLADLGLVVVEDACTAHGAERGGRRVGGLGAAGTFSFFFSHAITTVEGGMLVTNDDGIADAARSLRAHGWIRERTDAAALAAARPDLDPRFHFALPGYNLRPTEIAAAFGLVQLGRLPGFAAARRANHGDWCRRMAASGLPVRVFPEPPGTVHGGFAFPLLLPGAPPRCEVQAALTARGIATRPISGGNLARQPAAARVPGLVAAGPLPVADAVHDRGLVTGNSHAFGPAHGDLVVRSLAEILHG